VAQVSAREGQVVEPASPLFTIVDPSHVWVVGQLLEAQAVKVQPGTPIEAHFGGETSAGRVEGLGARLDPRRRTLPLWFTAENDAGRLRPGMFGQVRVPVARAEEAVVCPQAALRRDGNAWFALVREAPGKFLRRRVEVGLRSRGRAEVLDGLFPGDPVVTTGLQELAALFPAKGRRAPDEESPPPLENLVSRPAGTRVLSALAEIELPTDGKRFVSPALGGRLASLLVERGQFVRAGQLVGEVESLELAALVLDQLEAQTELDVSRAMRDQLAAPGVRAALPGQELWQLEARLESAVAANEALRAKLRLAGLAEEDLAALERLEPADMLGAESVVPRLPLLAPADGWLADFELSIGQTVTPDDRLFAVCDHARVWVRADLFQDDAARVRVGDEARVYFAADPALQVVGRVARVSPQLDDPGRTGSVWIEIGNPGGRLREGMLARALIFVAQQPAELAERAAGSRP
jgi:multidrug efflux pump subunit AcrA (membrane-fusion protein)